MPQTEAEMQRQRELLKDYIKRSILEEELNSQNEEQKSNYKLIYQSHVKNVTGLARKVKAEPINYRTESFQENLDGTEFKKEQKSLSKK